MEIPLSTILRFGICGVPELVPLEPPLFSQNFGFFEVSVELKETDESYLSRRYALKKYMNWSAEVVDDSE